MRAIAFAMAAAALTAGCATAHEAPVPAGIPYACAAGRPARVLYVGGGYFPRAAARLLYDGRTIDLQATPPTFGLRYVSADASNGPIFIWSTRGEEAWLSQIDEQDAAAEPREIDHCTRVREGGAGDEVGGADPHGG
jgi:membrane-bound inhibitor of C-type lysozyme